MGLPGSQSQIQYRILPGSGRQIQYQVPTLHSFLSSAQFFHQLRPLVHLQIEGTLGKERKRKG